MKLSKGIKIIKTKQFDVYVYPKGHTNHNRGLDDVYLDHFTLERDKNGKIISEKLEQYKDFKIKEIIHNTNYIGLIIESN